MSKVDLDEPGAVPYDDNAVIGVPGSASEPTVFVEVPAGVNGSDYVAALLEATGGEDKHYLVKSVDGGFEMPAWVYDAAHLPEEADYVEPAESPVADEVVTDPNAVIGDHIPGASNDVLGTPVGEPDDATLRELADMTVAELKAKAKADGIDLNGAKAKADIVAKIEDARA